MIDKKSVIEFQFKAVCSDAKFGDFDQMTQAYIDFLDNTHYSEFVESEIKYILQNANNEDIFKYQDYNWLKKRVAFIMDCLNDFWNIDLDVDFFLVSEFPGNFKQESWKAMSVTPAHQDYYHITKGVYYLDRYLIPNIFEIIVCHELIHQIIYKVAPKYSRIKTTLFEEGVCDYFSYIVLLKYSIIDSFWINRFVVINRALSGNINPIRYSYWIYSRIIENTYRHKNLYLNDSFEKEFASIIKSQVNSQDFEKEIEELNTIFDIASSKMILPEKEYLLLKGICRKEELTYIKSSLKIDNDRMDALKNNLQKKWLACFDGESVVNNIYDVSNIYYYIEETSYEKSSIN